MSLSHQLKNLDKDEIALTREEVLRAREEDTTEYRPRVWPRKKKV